MALFYFILKVGGQSYPDQAGEEFDDIADARAHAHAVACELMRNRENRTAHWRVEVCDDYLQPCCEILFADIDQRLDAYDEDFRDSFRRVARTTAGIKDALQSIDAAMQDLQQTLRLLDAATARFSQAGY
jgi:hypothetical protein